MSEMSSIENAPGGGSVLTKRRTYVLEVGEASVLAGHLAFPTSAVSTAARRALHRLPVPFWLLVEEVETFKAASSEIRLADSIIAHAYNAGYTIKYWILSDGTSELCPDQGGWFEAKYSRAPTFRSDNGRLTMHRLGLLIVDPPSLRRFRLGSYFQDQITKWAKSWPKASVDSVSLHAAQAKTDEDRITRNKFWERYGFRFVWNDPETMREGVSLPMTADELRVPASAPDRARHIQSVEVAQHLAHIQKRADGARKAHATAQRLSDYLYKLEECVKKHSLLWAVSGKWRDRTARLLEQSDARAEEEVRSSFPNAADASESALPSGAPAARTLQVFHELSRQGILETWNTRNAERVARGIRLDVQHLIDHPVPWRRPPRK